MSDDHIDLLARPITAIDDAEALSERARARLREGDLVGAERALAQARVKVRGAEGILAARRARL